jgi:menaquinone-dependent protoporphyrinogen oxidase
VVSVLMAYATRNGSTQEVAEAIAGALAETGAQATVRPARAVRESVRGYDLVVVGAPLYSGRWHRDAHRFLNRHRRELGTVPVAVFGMGPREDTESAWQRSRAQLDRALARRGWLSPVAVTVFGGVDPPGRRAGQRRDLRDWKAVHAWAGDTLAKAAQTGPGAAASAAATTMTAVVYARYGSPDVLELKQVVSQPRGTARSWSGSVPLRSTPPAGT